MTGKVPSVLKQHLEDIARQLSDGKAVVLVGSGFSKNATRRAEPRGAPGHEQLPEFPDVAQLQEMFQGILGKLAPDACDHPRDLATLASSVEVLVGRPEMERLLREAIPDDLYDPSALHVDLLNLPWADVFTTNYDTLLERSRPASCRYETIVNEGDMPGANKPRLIKLHGCLTSNRPLTITDEDYRQYQNDHQVFGNTMRQAMTENTLVLLGFSGNDPNFQHWNDWIKNHLRDEFAGVYYVGVGIDSLTAALRERDRVVCVDMSAFDDIGDSDHVKAIERFLGYIAPQAASPPPEQEGAPGQIPRWFQQQSVSRPDAEADAAESLPMLIETWRKDRQAYPGWIVAPASERERLWANTREWTGYLPDLNIVPHNLALEFAFELVWRMEKSLCPIVNNQVDFLEEALNWHLGHPDTPQTSWQQNDSTKPSASADLSLKGKCVRLKLALLRYYREEGKPSEWATTYHQINGFLLRLSPEHKARFYYERALFALNQLDMADLEDIMGEWPQDDSLPFWEAKRAGLLAHLGRINEAERILTKSRQTIQRRLETTSDDLTLLSQEALVLVALQYARSASSSYLEQPDETRLWEQEFDERWESLRQFRCNPWDETKAFREILDQEVLPPSHPNPSPPFDIGHVRGTTYLVQPNRHLLEAYNFLRYREDAGIPLRFFPKAVAQAAARIVATERHWAIAALMQTGDATEVDRVLNRITLTGLPTGYIDDLTKRCVTALDGLWRNNIESDDPRRLGLDNLLAKMLPEVLSRLCTRASTEAKDLLIESVVTIYRSQKRVHYRGIQLWMSRLLRSCSVAQRVDAIPKLLSIPALSNLNPLEEREYIHPFLMFDLKKDWIAQPPEMPHGSLARVMAEADSDDPATRKWALLTVGTLHELGLLNSEQTRHAATVLWNRVDADGLPVHTGYYRHAFLDLPAPGTVHPESLFRAYAQRAHFPIQPEKGGITLGSSSALCREIRGARRYLTWSTAEVESIISRLVQWWDADKGYLTGPDNGMGFLSIVGEFRQRFTELIRTAESVIAPPFYARPESNTKRKLTRLLDEMFEYGMPTLRLQVASLHIFPERRNEVLGRVKSGMASSSEEAVLDSLRALWVFAERTRSDGEAETKRQLADILQETVEILYWRRETGLPLAINTIADTLRMHPWALEESKERILVGLERLIGDTTIRPQPSALTGKSNMGAPLKLSVRQAAAHLAHTLYTYHTQEGISIPNVVMEWKSICHSDDEFAEIRNRWISAS